MKNATRLILPNVVPQVGGAYPINEFRDNFNRSAESLGASPNWTFVSGTMGACAVNASNSLDTTDTASSGTVYFSPDLGSDDMFVEAELKTTGAAGPFLCCRFVDGNNFIGVRDAGPATNQWQVYTRVGGTFTLVGSYAATPTAGDLFRLEVEGLNVRFILNGTTRINQTILEANALLGNTRQGVYSRLTSKAPWIDNYRAGTL